MDERLCVLLNLAVYLELIEDDSIVDEKFLFGNGVDGDRSVRDLLRTALENSAFKKILDGNLGTHSIRKDPATYCARNGVSRENIELRGRWRGYKKQVDTYIDIDRPLPDAQVASCLCGPSGAIMYCVDKVNWCSDVFLCDKIAPNVAKFMSPQVATVLAKPLLYAAVQRTSRLDSCYPLMPETLRQRILNHILVAGSYASLNDITQFVDRIPIAVSGFSGELNIDQIGLENVSPSGLGSAGSSGAVVKTELNVLKSVVLSVKRRQEEIQNNLQTELADLRRHFDRRFDNLLSISKRIAEMPISLPSRVTAQSVLPTTAKKPKRSLLCKKPRDLYELWHEYEFGIGGNKPAKDFTAKERGETKWTYCTRLVFWNLIKAMVNRNHTNDTAIDAVYIAYGPSSSVTQVLRQLRRDKGTSFRALII
ncbi:hypothetical protein AC1031_021123 [Aphanomyces cochlioides]|nr:hypothetical protein AC1031_021123 [Aphanomyces cochlioides]